MDEMIFALGIAVPEHKIKQEDLTDRTVSPLKLSRKLDYWLKKVSNLSDIKTRFSVLEDYKSPLVEGNFYGKNFPDIEPSMSKRMSIYQQEAPRLALNAAKDAISNWGEDAKTITHIISISCTGFIAPGIEVSLIKELGLNNDVRRFGLNFMGCMAAFNGLSAAQALAAEDPKNRVLIVCTELCTLHYHRSEKRETLLGHVLFGDGAACAIVGNTPTEKETPLWRFENKASWLLDDTQNEMSWSSGDNAYVMKLTSQVPKIKKNKSTHYLQS
ncbi:MAG: type III polyketide synthase [Gammaproteobacteria bacterium]|nr:type III polyketide synthase [Gammaproteobacteria bacterium]